MEKQKFRLFVRDKHFYLMLLAFALPICIQQVINVGVNMADNIMLGQLGEIQMSGATLGNNFINIYHAMCMGMGMGAGVLTSRFYGMGDQYSMKKAVVIMYRLEFLIATGFALAVAFNASGIMGMYTTDPAIKAAGTGYLMISIGTFYLNGYAVTSSVVLRSVGKAKVPMISSICSFGVNIFFNWVFIFGHLGAPRMEARGAALGTLLARCVEFIVTVGYVIFKDTNIGLRVKDLTMKTGNLIKEYIRISIPVLVSDTLLGFGNSAVAMVMGHIGPSFVAANAITMVVMQVSTVINQGISQASCTITGITLGKGEIEKAQQQGITFAALGFLIGAIGCTIINIISPFVISVYNITPETEALAYQLMRAVSITVFFTASNSILTKGVLRGGGDTRFLMVADILFLWVCSIPLGYAAGLVWHLSGFWIYLCLRIDQFIKSIWCLFRLRSRKWIKKIKNAQRE